MLASWPAAAVTDEVPGTIAPLLASPPTSSAVGAACPWPGAGPLAARASALAANTSCGLDTLVVSGVRVAKVLALVRARASCIRRFVLASSALFAASIAAFFIASARSASFRLDSSSRSTRSCSSSSDSCSRNFNQKPWQTAFALRCSRLLRTSADMASRIAFEKPLHRVAFQPMSLGSLQTSSMYSLTTAGSPSLALSTAPATVEQDFSKARGPPEQGARDAVSTTMLLFSEALHSAKTRACDRHLSARDAKEFATTSGLRSAWPARKAFEPFTLDLRQAA